MTPVNNAYHNPIMDDPNKVRVVKKACESLSRIKSLDPSMASSTEKVSYLNTQNSPSIQVHMLGSSMERKS